MITEVNVDNENKIIRRTLTGEIDKHHAIKLVREISFSVKCYEGYSVLVDMRDTTHHPEMADLLAIADECSRQLVGFDCRIAFVIPDTEQRKQVARLFRTCMEAQSFELRQFFEYEPAMEWLGEKPQASHRQLA